MSAALLTGRSALVTGAGRGIGAGISKALAEAGASVAVNYRSDARAAQSVVAAIGRGATAWRADVGDEKQVRALIDQVHERYGSIDVLVLNAGIWRGGRVDSLELGDWHHVLATSLDGAFLVARGVVPLMREAGFGRIVVISSAVGIVGYPGDAAYSTAKAGLVGFARALSKEVGRSGVTVNAVMPGIVDTDMTAAIPSASKERMVSRTSLGRSGTVEEVAAAVRFLVCEGGYVTGHALVVDGGFSL